MAAGRLVVPGWTPAVNVNGVPIPNAQMFFYLNRTTTLATVYADEALTVPLPNPILANSAGQWPPVWADDANLFSVAIDAPYGPPGVPFTFDDLGPSTSSNAGALNKLDRDAGNSETTFSDNALYQSDIADTFVLTQSEKFAETRNILEWISPTKHAAIKDGTLAGNLNVEIQLAVNSGAQRIFVPPGRYPINTDGFSVTMNTPSVTLFGTGRDSFFDDVAPATSEARAVFITTANEVTLQNFRVDSHAKLKVDPTWVPPGTTGAIALGGSVIVMGDRNVVDGLEVWNAWDNCIGIGEYNLTTGNQVDGSPKDCIAKNCITYYAGIGIQAHRGYLISLGSGIDNLCGSGTRIVDCTDYFSKVGFVNDYASGARGTFTNCRSLNATKSLYPLDSDPNIPPGFTAAELRPGGVGFYVASNALLFACEAFDSEKNGFWIDGYSWSCFGRGLWAKGSKEEGAWIQGRDNDIEIMCEACSYTNPGVYAAVKVEGAAATGIDTFVGSTNMTVSVNAFGPFHKHTVYAKVSFGLQGELWTGVATGTVSPILNEAPTTFHVAGRQVTAGLRGTGVRIFDRNCTNALVNRFGDAAGNGNMWLGNLDNPAKRLAFGVDGDRTRGVIEAIESGLGPMPLDINTSGGTVRTYRDVGNTAIGSTANPASIEVCRIDNRNKKVAVGYTLAGEGQVQALEDGIGPSTLALNPGGGTVRFGAGQYQAPVILKNEAGNATYLWVTDVGVLRIKTGAAPTSQTDGVVVGAQT